LADRVFWDETWCERWPSANYRIRVAVRRPELAGHLQPLGRVGQIHAVQANLRYPASVEAAMRDSHVAINLVGTLTESGAQTFDAVQAKGAETIARTAAAASARMVHVSAIGADENSPSAYGRSKAAGETAVLAAVPSATILRPSLLFGPEDQFTNRFASLARISPFLPLSAAGSPGCSRPTSPTSPPRLPMPSTARRNPVQLTSSAARKF
jgi:NADH dehydrogenase